MIAASYDLAQVDELAAAWAAAPQIAQRELHVFMEGATTYVQAEIQERTPGAHGTLKASWGSEVHVLADTVLGVVGTPLAYAIPVELGTRPHFPPVAAIEDWVKVKFGVAGPEARSIAFAVARKIAKHGTKGAFMVQNAFEASKPELERQARITLQAIADQMSGGAHR